MLVDSPSPIRPFLQVELKKEYSRPYNIHIFQNIAQPKSEIPILQPSQPIGSLGPVYNLMLIEVMNDLAILLSALFHTSNLY